MNHTCLFLYSRSWSSFADPRGMEGWVGLGGWLHTEINVRHWDMNPDTVIHLSTNRARLRLTSLIETHALPLCQTTHSTPTVASLCDQGEQQLFSTVTQNNTQPWQQCLPPNVEKYYSTRARPHDDQLPRKTSLLDECNFIYRMLYHDILPFMHWFYTVVTVACLFFNKEMIDWFTDWLFSKLCILICSVYYTSKMYPT